MNELPASSESPSVAEVFREFGVQTLEFKKGLVTYSDGSTAYFPWGPITRGYRVTPIQYEAIRKFHFDWLFLNVFLVLGLSKTSTYGPSVGFEMVMILLGAIETVAVVCRHRLSKVLKIEWAPRLPWRVWEIGLAHHMTADGAWGLALLSFLGVFTGVVLQFLDSPSKVLGQILCGITFPIAVLSWRLYRIARQPE